MPLQLAGILWLLFFTQVSALSLLEGIFTSGQLIDVGGRKLHSYCTGQEVDGDLDSCGGAFSMIGRWSNRKLLKAQGVFLRSGRTSLE